MTGDSKATVPEKQVKQGVVQFLEEVGGGAGRVRIAASQFCSMSSRDYDEVRSNAPESDKHAEKTE